MKNFTLKSMLLLFSLTMFFVQVNAMPAYNKLVQFTQPDGTKINIFLKGDENVKWAETEDGYSLVYNAQGFYEYAKLDYKNEMVPSGIVAKNIKSRTVAEKTFLQSVQKNLRYNRDQVHLMKKIQNIYKAEAQRAFPTTGTRKLVCVLIGFKDKAFTKTQAEFNNLFNQVSYTTGGATGSVRDFFLEASYNKFDLSVTVAGPFTAANNMSYYGGNDANGNDLAPEVLAKEAVTLANATVNFADFDNDADGAVDGVYVIYAGYGEEAGAAASAIWAHAWEFPAVTLDGKSVSRYSCSSEFMGTSGTTMTRIGVICHEFGHVLGAPDYYDTDYETGGQYEGTGEWDLQAGGSWNNNGATPAHPNAYTKCYTYGWATPTVISTAQAVTMQSSTTNATSFYRYNTTTTNEFYLLENRQKTGFNAYVPAHGLVVYHVDGTWVANHDNSNDINNTSHQGMYVVPANQAVANGIAVSASSTVNSTGAAFPGVSAKTSFSDTSTPNSKSWAAANTAKPLLNITESTGVISFNFISAVASPALTLSKTTLTGLNYSGAGPSASQTYTVSGANLSGFPGNVTVSSARNYEISTDNVTFALSVTVPYTSATLAAKTIYVRLKAGLAVASYNSAIIANAGGGATTLNVTCSGSVTATPSLTIGTPTLNDFIYVYGKGPSASQTFSIRGANLTGYPGNVTITAPTNYEVSLSSTTGYAASVNVAYTTATLASTTVYVRLKSALAVNSYINANVVCSGGGATSVNATCNGAVRKGKILFDATKAETAANADWVIDEDTYTLLYSSAGTVATGGSEGTAQRMPTPSQTLINSSTPETYWNGGLSSFGVDMVKQGYAVETLPWNGTISYGNTTNTQDLANYEVFVMCEPNIMLTATEKTAILNYVNAGGGLYMLADHGGLTPADRNNDGKSSIDVFNDLMAGNVFGMTFDNLDYSYNTTNIATATGDPLLAGAAGTVGEHEIHGSTTMTLNKTTNLSVKGVVFKSGVSTTGTLSCNVAYSTYGKGRVVGMGDSSPAEDPTGDPNDVTYDGWIQPTTGLNIADNGTLITNASIWLSNAKKLVPSVASHSGFTYASGSGPSAVKNFTLAGTELSGTAVTVSVASNYEVSLSSTTGFASSISITYTAPTLVATTVYVRLKAGLTANSYNNLLTANIGGGISANVTLSGTVTAPVTPPSLSLSTSTLTGFSYIDGFGPSTSKSYTISGSNLTGYPSNVVVSCANNYEVSTNNSTFATSVNVAYTSATLAATTVYVRLKAGQIVGAYNNVVVSNVGSGITTNVTCSGDVLAAPSLSLNPSSLIGFAYNLGSGPSVSQSFNIRGANLTGYPSNISIAAPTNYELSLDNVTFASNVLVPFTSVTLTTTNVYVRLKSALAVNSYNNETISISGGGVNGVSVICNGDVNPAPSITTCGNEDFENSALTATYANGSFTGNNTVVWTYVSSRDVSTYGITGKGIMLRSSAYFSNLVSSAVTGGISKFTCSLKKAFTAAGNRQVELFVNGVSKGASVPFDNALTNTFTVENINVSGDVVIELRNLTTYQITVDDISWDCYSAVAVPKLIVTSATLAGFNYLNGSGPSASQSYEISGENLTGFPSNITITAPTSYEVSLNNATFSSSVLVPYTGATLSSTIVYVRLKAGLAVAQYNDLNITHSGAGATNVNVACSGSVTNPSLACGNETFDNSALTTSYLNGSFTGNNGVVWTYVSSRDVSTYGINGKGIMLRANTYLSKITSSTVTGGISSFTCNLRKAFTGTGNRQVELYINGILKGTSIAWDNTSIVNFAVDNINVTGNITIEIRSKSTLQVIVDDISWDCYSEVVVTPTLAVDNDILMNFSYINGSGPSASQLFNLSGTNLVGAPGNLTITAPVSYEVSTNNSTFASTALVAFNNTTLAATPIYVRLKAGLSVATYDEIITISGGNATSVEVLCGGSVTNASSACGSETFDNSALTATYANGSFVGNNGVTWTYVSSRTEDVYGINGKGIMLRSSTYFSNLVSSTVIGGIGSFSCNLRKAFTGAGNRQVELFVNGVSKGKSIAWDNTSIVNFAVDNINVSGNVVIEIKNALGYQVIVDDISWTCYTVKKSEISNNVNLFEPELSIYPNPNNGTFKLDFNGEISKISVYDITGKVIYSNSKIESNEINLNAKQGLYFVEVQSENNKLVRKLIVE